MRNVRRHAADLPFFGGLHLEVDEWGFQMAMDQAAFEDWNQI